MKNGKKCSENCTILGISCYYHDSSACIIKDGKMIAAAQEERFTRKKHDNGYPENAVKFCLQEAGTSMDKIDFVAFYEKPYLKFERLLFQFIETFPKSSGAFVRSLPSWLSEKLLVPYKIKKAGFKGETYFFEHHLSHAASSYLVSKFKEATIVTIDGVGEWATTTIGHGKENDIEIIKEIHFPHSIGLLYSAFTAFLGFKVNNSEYKVMGLAPYGEPKYVDKISKVIKQQKDGSFYMDMDYFCYHYKEAMPSKKFIEEFGPIRKPETELTQYHKDLTASLQKKTEELIMNLLNAAYKETKCKNLCLAGGVALNSVANGKIISETPYEKIFIQPSAGDSGCSIGAAYYLYNSVFGNKRNFVLQDAFLGSGYSDSQITEFIKENNIVAHKFSGREQLLKETAKDIFNDKVIGWFQGRMEWGPRALGARSILSNPCNPNMKDILNLKVKHREQFRPFAPVITEEDVDKYFEADIPVQDPAYYMLMVYPIRKKWHSKIPSVTHVNGSGRLQVIARNQHQLYYDLIKEFEKLSGIPILINTSFNIRGEPIVRTPAEAYKCMTGTGIDELIIGNYKILREENPKDWWDSENLAKQEEKS